MYINRTGALFLLTLFGQAKRVRRRQGTQPLGFELQSCNDKGRFPPAGGLLILCVDKAK
jgi:hypothetical protein